MKTDNANRLADTKNIYIPGFKRILNKKKIESKKNVIARWRPFWLSVESWKFNRVISILIDGSHKKLGRSNNYLQVIALTIIFLKIHLDLWPTTLTLGKKNCRKGLKVCMNYAFYLLHHIGVAAKRRAAAAETAAAAAVAAETAHEGDDNTP